MYREIKELYEFGPFRLDVEEHTLTRTDGPINDLLPEKAFQTLCFLVQKRGHLLTKQELLSEIWPDSFVEENNLDKCIHAIRQTLGEKPGDNKYIETVRKHGYRFVAEVNTLGAPRQHGASVLDSEFLTEWTPNSTLADNGRVIAPSNQSLWTSRSPIIFIGIFLVVAAIGSAYFLYPAKEAVAKNRTEFAVLPVNPIDPATRSDLYEIGIADSLIQTLNSVKGFVVRPLSATRKYTEIGQDPLAAGREQMVDYVLASNYQIADGKIRITSQLYNIQSGLVEGSFKVEQENSTIFVVQDAVAANIGRSLLKRLDREPDHSAKRFTTNEEAYRLYIQGKILAGKRNDGDERKAIEYFEQAVRLDPNFALAYAELASAHSRGFNDGGRKATEEYLKAKAAIEKALAIDDNLAEAHSYFGVIKSNYEWDFAGAEVEHKRAVELNPNSSTVHCLYAMLLGILGKTEESIAEMKTAIDLEPDSVANHHGYGWLLFQARRYDEAIAEEERVVEMDPTIIMANNVLANSYGFKGEDDKSFEAFVRMRTLRRETPEEISSLKAVYARSGWRGIFERQLKEALADEKKRPS
jgi:DNA-binding winged helix-turn-helix (wHTH) protein/tetratricopeptide (TPR) repeat protein